MGHGHRSKSQPKCYLQITHTANRDPPSPMHLDMAVLLTHCSLARHMALETLSTLVWVMAYCLTTPSHYQCWLTINKVLCHSFQDAVYLGTQDINLQTVFEIHTFEITDTFPREQWLKWQLSIWSRDKMAGCLQMTFSTAFYWHEKDWISNKIQLRYVSWYIIDNMPSLDRLMACRLVGSKLVSKALLIHYQLDHKEQTSEKFESKYNNFYTTKDISKCHLQNVGHFVCASICWMSIIYSTPEHFM